MQSIVINSNYQLSFIINYWLFF